MKNIKDVAKKGNLALSTFSHAMTHFLKNLMVESMYACRPHCVDTMVIQGPEPIAHPPTAIRVRNAGFFAFKEFRRE